MPQKDYLCSLRKEYEQKSQIWIGIIIGQTDTDQRVEGNQKIENGLLCWGLWRLGLVGLGFVCCFGGGGLVLLCLLLWWWGPCVTCSPCARGWICITRITTAQPTLIPPKGSSNSSQQVHSPHHTSMQIREIIRYPMYNFFTFYQDMVHNVTLICFEEVHSQT